MSQQIGPKVPGDVLSTDVIVLKIVFLNYLTKEDDH